LCNIAAGSYTLTTVYSNAKASTSEKTAEEKKKEARYLVLNRGVDVRETYAVKYQLAQDVFDALIPAGSLGYLAFMDEGLIGLAGVVSSLLGGYTQWIKTK
jgi:peroxin-11B